MLSRFPERYSCSLAFSGIANIEVLAPVNIFLRPKSVIHPGLVLRICRIQAEAQCLLAWTISDDGKVQEVLAWMCLLTWISLWVYDDGVVRRSFGQNRRPSFVQNPLMLLNGGGGRMAITTSQVPPFHIPTDGVLLFKCYLVVSYVSIHSSPPNYALKANFLHEKTPVPVELTGSSGITCSSTVTSDSLSNREIRGSLNFLTPRCSVDALQLYPDRPHRSLVANVVEDSGPLGGEVMQPLHVKYVPLSEPYDLGY
ncbi:hypothetical protein Tco_0824409 [Tanacetum coccineum]|uniref:Uncharacterized protein n=1 Tax=Tanacetum coccineum TaxID=301880 RepID=A0ABQ5AKU7_9ASTR